MIKIFYLKLNNGKFFTFYIKYKILLLHNRIIFKFFLFFIFSYFFVTSCEELENLPIQEEITDDNQFLPLWKGKVNAQIKAIE